MKKFLFIVLLAFIASVCYAQQIVRGVVTSGNAPVTGASVYEKDKPESATMTNEKGEYRLQIKGEGILVFQSVGLVAKQINVAGKTDVNVSMTVDIVGLQDVVVVGYGQKKKIANTASVSQISGDDIRATPVASLQNALIGRVPGVVTQQRSGKPGSDGGRILIRGLSSMASGDNAGAPLIIVDDLEYAGALSEIDPDQVESFTVLKDAASTAVFGIKGANGVIVIVTRRGKSGRPKITLRSENAAQRPTYLPKYLDSYNSARLRNEALKSDSLPAFFTDQDLQLFKDGTDPYGHPNVNWQDVLLRKYSLQSYDNLNITGGTDKAKYFISAGYLWQNGMVKDFTVDKDLNSNYYYKRYNFRSNLDFTATKTTTLNIDLSGNFSERNEPNILGRNNRNNVFFEISDYNQLPPFAYAPYNPDGSYGSNGSVGSYSNNVIGRFAFGGYNRAFDNNTTANLRLNQKLDALLPGLSLRGIVGYNAQFRFWRSMTRTEFPSFKYDAATDKYTPFSPTVFRLEKLNLGYFADAPNSFKKLNYQASLNYDHNFNGHHLTGLALFNQTSNVEGANIPYYFRGFAFRAGYDYNQRYLFELNAGYNGSSRFSSTKRYSWFPALSVGWNIAEEKFFKEAVPDVQVLKLRGSIGVTGTDELATGNNYAYLQVYSRSGTYSIGEVHTPLSGIIEGTLGTDVTWEKERQSNVGIDVKMLGGRLNLTADWFDRYRHDILITRGSVPNILGVGLPPVNLGEVQNRGFEVDLGYNDHIGKDFTYSVKGNISVAKNKILYMDEASPAYPWLFKTGNPLGSIAGYTWIGFYTSEEDAKNSAQPVGIKPRPGDLKYADLNGDKVIDVNDQGILKYPNLPNTIIGFTGTFGYKGLSLSFTFQSALNFANRKIAESINPFSNNLREIHANYWRPDNTNPDFPRLSTVGGISNASAYPSDYWFRRTDYLRLKTAQLSYDLPKGIIERAKMQGVRVYLSGYNLLTWMLKEKNIYEVDPETPSGTEGGDYPVQRVYNVGVQVTF